jgi:SAM-dependent methyltransferase
MAERVTGRAGWFPEGRSLAGELAAAMQRIAARGVTYPAGYAETLVEKYSATGVGYPHILMILGMPRIHRHFFYAAALKRGGRLLDYGCGTMDNVRQLIRDGFPRERITAFDINRQSIDLGFDLYRDRGELEPLVVVSASFPFGPEEFDTIYSASVIHVIANETEFGQYLANAYAALRPGGVFFGSTLGLPRGAAGLPGSRGPPRILTREQLARHLIRAGFSSPEIAGQYGVPDYVPQTEKLCVLVFCTRKPAS